MKTAVTCVCYNIERFVDSSAGSSTGSTSRHQRSAGKLRPADLSGDRGVGEHDQDAAAGASRCPAAALLQTQTPTSSFSATAGPQGQHRHSCKD